MIKALLAAGVWGLCFQTWCPLGDRWPRGSLAPALAPDRAGCPELCTPSQGGFLLAVGLMAVVRWLGTAAGGGGGALCPLNPWHCKVGPNPPALLQPPVVLHHLQRESLLVILLWAVASPIPSPRCLQNPSTDHALLTMGFEGRETPLGRRGWWWLWLSNTLEQLVCALRLWELWARVGWSHLDHEASPKGAGAVVWVW